MSYEAVSMDVRTVIARLTSSMSLSDNEMEAMTGQIMAGEVSPAQIGALLTALRMKGETRSEIVGAARAMRAHAAVIRPRAEILVDTCGTGGDLRGTFNVSTAAAFITAGAGLSVAKHGNRAMSGAVGGADVLEALGVQIELPPQRVEQCIDEIGIGFLFAPVFHPAMRHVAVARRELGIRTIFNLLGPLSNPAGARRQVVGVFSSEWTEPLAGALAELGAEHVLVVHGEDGLDEISLTGATRVTEYDRGSLRTYRLLPSDLGFSACSFDDLICSSREESAEMIRAILAGAEGPRASIAILNAAAAIYVGGGAASIAAAVDRARESIRSGRARQKLNQMVELTNR